jgi:tartrate-resistant acid phosphatase type 5
VFLAVVLAVAAALLCAPAAAELPRIQHASAKNDGSLSLLVVGDWGRKGTHNQSRVADQVRTSQQRHRRSHSS